MKKSKLIILLALSLMATTVEAKIIPKYSHQDKVPCFKGQISHSPKIDLDTITNSDKIKEALQLLIDNGFESSVNEISKNNIKVMFWNFEVLKVEKDWTADHRMPLIIRKYDHVHYMNEYFLISDEFEKDSPPEALAAIIAYRMFIRQMTSTFSEQVDGLNLEASVWKKLKDPNKQYENTRLISRLDEVTALYDPNSLKLIRKWVKDKGFTVICGGM